MLPRNQKQEPYSDFENMIVVISFVINCYFVYSVTFGYN